MSPTRGIQWSSADDRAVSPVIGVILMVAITVVLAAVIGTLVLDLGQTAGAAAPSASLSVSAQASTGNVTVSHAGGDGLSSARTRVVVTNGSSTVTFDALDGQAASVLSVGEEATIALSAGGNGIDWDGDGAIEWQAEEGNAFTGIVRGDRITVQFIDTERQRVIFETEITA